MRSARDAAIAMHESVGALGASPLARGSSLFRRLHRRLLDPLTHSDPLCWRNATRGVRLFVGAAFAGLREDGGPAPEDRVVSALFCFGAIDESARLGRFSDFARRRTELDFLRRAYGLGRVRAHRMRRHLRAWEATFLGRTAMREGRTALREWLRGIDPAPRLRELVDDEPADRLGLRRRALPILVRRDRTARAPAGAGRHAG